MILFRTAVWILFQYAWCISKLLFNIIGIQAATCGEIYRSIPIKENKVDPSPRLTAKLSEQGNSNGIQDGWHYSNKHMLIVQDSTSVKTLFKNQHSYFNSANYFNWSFTFQKYFGYKHWLFSRYIALLELYKRITIIFLVK